MTMRWVRVSALAAAARQLVDGGAELAAKLARDWVVVAPQHHICALHALVCIKPRRPGRRQRVCPRHASGSAMRGARGLGGTQGKHGPSWGKERIHA